MNKTISIDEKFLCNLQKIKENMAIKTDSQAIAFAVNFFAAKSTIGDNQEGNKTIVPNDNSR